MNESYWLELSDGKTYEYQVALSNRAKYIRIKLSNTGELSVIVPNKRALKKAHQFIKSKTGWIEKQLLKVSVEPVQAIPDSLYLALLNEFWLIETIATDTSSVSLEEKPDFTLRLEGCIDNIDLVKKVINLWCKNKCRKLFNSMLENIAEEYGFHYKRLSIRSQKTRWGSCSSSKSINLNSKLLFMPEDVVRYVMIHELCHTIEMNHSSRFWKLVEECDPNYQLHKRLLKEEGRSLFL